MRIAVFDSSSENRRSFKEYFIVYSVRYNREFDVIWFTEEASERDIKELAPSIDLAYISLDDASGLGLGELVYRRNSDCLICYYSAKERELASVLHTRPFRFILFPSECDVFIDHQDALIRELSLSKDHLTIETRKQLYSFCKSNILYIRSDLKYVDIIAPDGSSEHIFYKLSDIEARMGESFLRIHKSYLVNTAYIERVGKSSHTVTLRGGTELPVSTPYYKALTDLFEGMSS